MKFIGLVSENGKTLKAFQQDPVKYIPYMLDLQLKEDKEDIAKKIMAQYFDSAKPYEDQLTAIEQVIKTNQQFRKATW